MQICEDNALFVKMVNDGMKAPIEMNSVGEGLGTGVSWSCPKNVLDKSV